MGRSLDDNSNALNSLNACTCTDLHSHLYNIWVNKANEPVGSETLIVLNQLRDFPAGFWVDGFNSK